MSKNRNNRGNTKDSPNRGENPTQTEKCRFSIPTVQAVRIEPSSEDKEKYSNEENYRRKQLDLSVYLNWITAIAAAISLLALAALFISLWFTRIATQAATKQATTAQREFESSQRPWLATQYAHDALLVIAPDSISLQMAVSMSNVGHSIAQNVIFRPILMENWRGNLTDCETWSENVEKQAAIVSGGIVIFPNQVLGPFTRAAFLTKDKIADAFRNPDRPGKVTFKVVGCVAYTSSIDDKPHHTKFVFNVMPKGSSIQNDFDLAPTSQNIPVDLEMDINQITAN
ncbi:hypothetical protein RBB79_12160 [Tunturiibacter empetritectus]|uniref:Uncharacterized protein n=1 Tax=Tunturiibacter lichenicola TaxID=2051959 RepID=A0A852VBQ2_9BACT|nr:hypothetical protein [Edaphobacter lichenicola]NYF90338.1 hypothetical protein [Edaphobacter lichenicola]